jgi:hypothetical protein
MDRSQKCLRVHIKEDFLLWGWYKVNQTNLVALRILASLQGLMRNISHSERLRFHPKS